MYTSYTADRYLRSGNYSGGGGGDSGDPYDPKVVYKNTRPKDWLPMPEPQDDEMYLLFHIPDCLSSLIAFTVTCEGDYKVETGTVKNGKFVSQTEKTFNSGVKYEDELFADDYDDLTTDCMKQVMIKVSGTNIQIWTSSTHRKKTAPANYYSWNIVDISCRLPYVKSFKCGNATASYALNKLKYFSMYGKNSITSCSNMFSYCFSLVTIQELDTRAATNTIGMFRGCYSLVTIPKLDTGVATNMESMFEQCYSLVTIPELDTSVATNMKSMFSNCYSLVTIPKLDTGVATNMPYMFQSCYSLVTIPELDTSAVTDLNYMFRSCLSLSSLKLKKDISWNGINFSIGSCNFERKALVDLFESLPSISATRTITIGGNPGATDLTDDDKKIATDKGWTLNTTSTS